MPISATDLNKAYLAYFGRPADLTGKTYFATLEQADVIKAFDASAESKASYGDNVASKVNAIYQNLFNRDAEPEGLVYWTTLINQGRVTAAGAALAILNGAQGTDTTAVTNKLAASEAFVAALNTTPELVGYSGMEAAASARSWLKAVGADAASLTAAIAGVDAAVTAAVAVGGGGVPGATFTLTNSIDNRTGTAGNDTFIGDNTSVNAADTINGGAGNDLVKLYNTVSLPNLTGVESLQINGHEGNVNAASIADLTSVELKDVTLTATGAPTYTVAGTQTLTITNVKDSDEDNADGVEINAATSVTAQSIKLNAAGDAATGGIDLNIDINGTGVATLNVDSSTAASRVAIENTGAAIRTLNITGDAAVTIEAESVANNVGALATAISITNTAGASVVSSAAPSATTGLVITAVGGKDTVTLAQAAGANALTNKVAVDLGAGNDTLKITNLTAATDIADGASFKGGDGVDTLNIVAGAVLDATRGKLFSGFETVDLAASAGAFDLGLLAANNTITTLKLSAANAAGGVSVTNLAETASVVVNAATAGNLAINQKDSGAGSPDDVINVTYDSKTAIGAHTGTTTIADIETVNLKVTSTGTNISHEITSLVVANATKVTVDASTAAVDIKTGFDAVSLVLFDASTSAKSVKAVFDDAYVATAGVAVKGGAAADTFVFTGAATGATAVTGLDFVVTGNGGADSITLAAAGAGVDKVVYLAQGDSTYAKYDTITNFTANGDGTTTGKDLLDIKAFGFTGTQQEIKTVTTGVTIAADSSVVVATGSQANFFVDTGIARGVAEFEVGGATYVFVDANKDGNFSNADDLVIKLAGVTAANFDATDIVFA